MEFSYNAKFKQKMKSLSDSSTSESEDDGGKFAYQRNRNNTEYSSFSNNAVSVIKPAKSSMPSYQNFSGISNSIDQQEFPVLPSRKSSHPIAEKNSDEESNLKNDMPSFQAMSQFSSPTKRKFNDVSSLLKTTEEAPPSKKIKANESKQYNDAAQKMMSKMGWTSGQGLGKHGQGRTDIIETSKQRGRRGLGLRTQHFEPADVIWDSGQEKETVEENIVWLPSCGEDCPTIEDLRNWKKEGKKKRTIEDETNFCDPGILKKVLSCKSVFDELEPEEMRKARTRSNPFETIRGGIFLNRAAMKMANMDSCFDFMFTNPKDKEEHCLVGPNDLLYFADVCAGPGGFSEYVLWRKKWECKGFGFTLKGPNDFKLEEFFSGSPETFEPHYGVNGIDGDGDVYNPNNLKEFQRFVLSNTEEKGVHFMMADGGFSVDGQENLQEVLSKRLYLCQFLCCLMVVRTGGHFVCKLFDLFTPFSVGLVYLMYRAFEHVSIHKPNTSRPANSERYIICKWKKEDAKDICDYMFELNLYFEEYSSVLSEKDIIECVPLDIMKEDEEFFTYIFKSNCTFGARQVIHLDKIKTYTQNVELHEHLQSDYRKKSLQLWQVPDKVRAAPSRPEPAAKFKELLKESNHSYLHSEPQALNENNLKKLSNIHNFKCVVCGELALSNSYRGYFLSLGRSNIYRLDAKNSKWIKVEGTLELPSDTLFYAELIPELKGESKAQRKIMCLQIIDTLFLGGKDVRSLHFEERMNLARKLAKAVTKTSRSDYIPIKVKKIWPLTEIQGIINKLVSKYVKGRQLPRLCFDSEGDRHFLPSGLLIFETVALPWVTAYSKTFQKVYYFNTKTKDSKYDQLTESATNFKQSFSNRFFWSWENEELSDFILPKAKNNGSLFCNKITNFVFQMFPEAKN